MFLQVLRLVDVVSGAVSTDRAQRWIAVLRTTAAPCRQGIELQHGRQRHLYGELRDGGRQSAGQPADDRAHRPRGTQESAG